MTTVDADDGEQDGGQGEEPAQAHGGKAGRWAAGRAMPSRRHAPAGPAIGWRP